MSEHNAPSERVNDVTPMPSTGTIIRAEKPSAYTPTTDEVRSCWVVREDIGNPYETDADWTERHRRRGAEFDRWLAKHDAEVRAGAGRVTDVELDRACDIYQHDDRVSALIGQANMLSDYEERQAALLDAERVGLRKAIDSVLEGRQA